MDYLQIIVRRFKTKNVIPKPTSRIVDIFDWTKYRDQHVNHKQISHIMKYVKWYATKISEIYKHIDHLDADPIFDDDMTDYEKVQLVNSIFFENVSKYRIAYSTMLFIIKEMERKDYYRYRNILFPMLLGVCRQSFIDAVVKSTQDIDVLVEPGCDIKLYDFGYNIKKNQEFFAKK